MPSEPNIITVTHFSTAIHLKKSLVVFFLKSTTEFTLIWIEIYILSKCCPCSIRNAEPCSHCLSSNCSIDVGMLQLAPVPPAHSVLPFTGDPKPLLPLPFSIPAGFGGADMFEIGPLSKGSAPSPPIHIKF